jgi:hypothetical protein
MLFECETYSEISSRIRSNTIPISPKSQDIQLCQVWKHSVSKDGGGQATIKQVGTTHSIFPEKNVNYHVQKAAGHYG